MNFDELRIKSVLAVIQYHPNNLRWAAKNRKNHIIGISLSGNTLHIMENQRFNISEGCVFFLNKKDDYNVEVYEPGDSLSIHFDTYEEIITESFCFPIQNSIEIISILQKAKIAKSAGNELGLLALLYKFCEIIEKARLKLYAPSDERIILAKNYIDQHFTEYNCLEIAINESKIGSRRFRDLFKQSFDMTPRRYITLKKVEMSKNLLSARGLTISKVSELCGFSDVYYFSKVFKQICGLPPSDWK